MIQIKISEIKEFFSRCRHIKTATIVPVFACIKLECKDGVMTLSKANGHSFVTHVIEGVCPDGTVMLIEEKSLSIMCDKPGSDTITISRDGGRVLLSDGKYKQSFVEEDGKIFFKFPEISNSVEHQISGEVLQAVHAASKYVGEVIDQYAFVYTIGRGVYASNRHVVYSKKFDCDLPPLTLSNTCCEALAYYSDVVVIEEPNHLIFKSGKTVLGFNRFDYNTPAFERMVDGMRMGATCTFSKADLIAYCDRVVKMASNVADHFTIEHCDGDSLLLNFDSPELSVSNVVKIPALYGVQFGFSKPFLGSAAQFRKLLSPLANDDITISLCMISRYEGLLFTSEENQLSFITGMQRVPVQ